MGKNTEIKSILLILVMFLFGLFWIMTSCTEPVAYTYEWEINVIYTNGDSEYLYVQQNSYDGVKCNLALKVMNSGLLVNNGTTPCLIIKKGLYIKPIAFGVRRYIILTETKTQIN